MEVTRQPASCGALIRGVDLTKDLNRGEVAAIRAAWLEHQVVAFPDQPMDVTDIERFATYMGPNGEDPYIEAIAGHPRVVQVRREADEKTPIFAETWHSDWSFLKRPPAATVLYGNIIPPAGGDTLFSNQYAAWDALSGSMRALLKDKMAIHSARKGLCEGWNVRRARQGPFDGDQVWRLGIENPASSARAAAYRNRDALRSTSARVTRSASTAFPTTRPLPILKELYAHQARPEFVYRHKWTAGMLIMWDNRSVIHAATGGYEGHRRLLHRITVADRTLQ